MPSGRDSDTSMLDVIFTWDVSFQDVSTDHLRTARTSAATQELCRSGIVNELVLNPALHPLCGAARTLSKASSGSNQM